MIPSETIFASLRSELCPICGGVKHKGYSFCGECISGLNWRTRTKLCQGGDTEYAEAMRAVLADVKEPKWPGNGKNESEAT